jgi:xanthine dehydrogenase accessory factor
MQLFFSNLVRELEHGDPLALAILVKTRGSTPQVPGASAIIGKQGLLHGTLGGGAMEGEILSRAMQSMTSHDSFVAEYNLDSASVADTDPICGGYATILVDTEPETSQNVFKILDESLRSNQSGVLVTSVNEKEGKIKSIKRAWVSQDEVESYTTEEKSFEDNGLLLDMDLIFQTLNSRKSWLKESPDKDHKVFYQAVFPDPQLIIVGAGHVGKALSHLGKLLDFQVTVIDDRPDHANRENIPDADHIISNDIETDIGKVHITGNSYIVIVTHGHKKDGIALKRVIHSEPAYIGMIGSRRKTRLLKEEFLANNWATKEELDSIYAPIGLDIHSKTVQEIAISIAGQLVKVRQEINALRQGKDIEIIILAAGKSERMGQQKLLMPYGGKTIIENIIEKALASRAGAVKVVVGSNREEVCDLIKDHSVQIIENTAFEKGMLSSVQCGFEALSSSASAGMILLGDQPMVQTLVIDKLIESFQKSRKGIIIPVYNKKRGHPVLIDTKYLLKINNLDPGRGLRQLMEENPEDIYEVEVDTKTILKDIDTIEDYKRELI